MPPFSPPLTRATSWNGRPPPGYATPNRFHENYQDISKNQKQGVDRSDGDHDGGRNLGKSKDSLVGTQALKAVNDVQATSLFDPIPADSVSKDTTLRTALTITPTFSVTSISNAGTLTQTSRLAGYSSNARSTTTVWIPASKHTTFHSAPSATNAARSSSPSASSHLPVYGIVALAVGAIGLAIGALLVLRCCLRRHTRVDRPRPSAPILQESPLFGGKERFSRGIWSDPSFSNLLASHAKTDGWRPLSGGKESASEKVQNKRQSLFPTANLSVNNSVQEPLSPASVYTMTVPQSGVGIALEFPIPPQTITPSVQPLKVKSTGTGEKPARRRSATASMYGSAAFGSRTLTDTENAIAYEAPRRAPMPGKSKPALKASASSREHGQKPTRKNIPSQGSRSSLYRSSSASRTARSREQEDSFMYAIPSVKSQERRDRDTKALTSALGLSSPPAPMSCFSPVSIYPDDSLSVAQGRGYGRPMSDAPPSEMPSPTGTHAAIGDLMLQDFPSTATFNSLRSADPFAGEPVVKQGGKGRVNDRPPRVPSPPPLPSLSQMALAGADPDYRSPTYSIYGLYEAQRKSRASLHGIDSLR